MTKSETFTPVSTREIFFCLIFSSSHLLGVLPVRVLGQYNGRRIYNNIYSQGWKSVKSTGPCFFLLAGVFIIYCPNNSIWLTDNMIRERGRSFRRLVGVELRKWIVNSRSTASVECQASVQCQWRKSRYWAWLKRTWSKRRSWQTQPQKRAEITPNKGPGFQR